MIGVALRGLAGRKLRTALTLLAIVLGVAMVSGTYVFTDTIEKAIDTLLTDAYMGSDAVITGKDVVEASTSGDATVPAALLATVEALPDVEAASGGIVDFARLIDKRGEPISTPDRRSASASTRARAASTRFASRRAAGRPERTRSRSTSARPAGKASRVGETIGVANRGTVRRFTISGIADFSSLDSIGALTLAIFDIPTSQALFGKSDRFDEIFVAAKDGVSAERSCARSSRSCPERRGRHRPRPRRASEAEGIERGHRGLSRSSCSPSRASALFVGGFVIFNTLSTTIAQRTRELATLRTLGASRRQVLGSVLLESLSIGIVASAIGLVLRPGAREGPHCALRRRRPGPPADRRCARSADHRRVPARRCPDHVASGLFPALRATSVPPIAAVREGALPRSPLAPYAPYIAGATITLGVGLLGSRHVRRLASPSEPCSSCSRSAASSSSSAWRRSRPGS